MTLSGFVISGRPRHVHCGLQPGTYVSVLHLRQFARSRPTCGGVSCTILVFLASLRICGRWFRPIPSNTARTLVRTAARGVAQLSGTRTTGRALSDTPQPRTACSLSLRTAVSREGEGGSAAAAVRRDDLFLSARDKKKIRVKILEIWFSACRF